MRKYFFSCATTSASRGSPHLQPCDTYVTSGLTTCYHRPVADNDCRISYSAQIESLEDIFPYLKNKNIWKKNIVAPNQVNKGKYMGNIEYDSVEVNNLRITNDYHARREERLKILFSPHHPNLFVN